jgi:AraC-like DNA-binding protein/mannose-6-phosphate isomerase-like protein (cupin superfamily)
MLYVDTTSEGAKAQLLGVRSEGVDFRFKLLHMNLADRKMREPYKPHKEHSHDVYHVALFRRGGGRFLLRGRPTHCEPGTLVLVSPGEEHDFGPEGAGELEFAELTFSFLGGRGEHLRIPFAKLLEAQFGQAVGSLELPFDLPEAKAEELFALFVACYEALSLRNVQGEAQVSCAFLRVFVFLADFLRPPAFVSSRDEMDLPLLKAKDAIEKGFASKFSLESLADGCGLSSAYFCRRFKKAFGLAPMAFVMKTRVEAAKSLLLSTGLSCKRIGAAVGFEDPRYFNRVFGKACGTSPQAFRKALRPS